jgi:ComEC/Rec2-related protein
MSSRRVPLFPVSLAFATGCLLGLDGLVSWPVALALFALALAAWLIARRNEQTSLAFFYLLTIAAGLTHTLVLAASVAPDDLRRLPDDKLLASTQWRGKVIEEPALQASPHLGRRALDRTSFALQIEAWRATQGQLFGEDVSTPWRSAEGRVSCTLLGPAQDLRGGDEIEFSAPLVPIAPPLVPGQLDLRAWSAARGIYYEVTPGPLNWRRLDQAPRYWWQGLSYRLRDWAYVRLQLGLEDDPRTADFLAGMLIGYRQEIPADIEQDFRQTGTLHVFAISGQNIAEMLVVAVVLLQLCGLVRWRWAWMLAPVVLLYCLLAGSPASAVRATVMALAILLAWRLGRPLNALGCWSIAFLAMLIWSPDVLLDPGAQLSFGVVLGLILIAPPTYRWLVRHFQHDPFLPASLLSAWQAREEKLWSQGCALLAASVAATLVSEPITALDFYQVTPISVVANLLVVPLAGLITVVGTISVTASLVLTPLAELFNNANWLFAKVLIGLVAFFAHEPGAAINVPDLRALGSPTPSFVVAPIQDSACLLVRNGARAWLVNTGREVPVPSVPGRLLQFYGVNRLEGLILAEESGPDNGGAALIARQFQPRHLVLPLLDSRSPWRRELPQILAATNLTPERWRRGDAFDLGSDLRLEVLGPASDSAATRVDNRSLVLLFHAGDATLLWAGRLDAEGQAELLRAYPHLHADVLVLGDGAVPGVDWLNALGVQDWLRLPPHERRLNAPTAQAPIPFSGTTWPLEKTGAVTVHFVPATQHQARGASLQPWAALPVASEETETY